MNKDIDIAKVLPTLDVSKLTLDGGDSEIVAELLGYLKKTGDTAILDDIFFTDYDEKPVTPKEFLNSTYFLGPFCYSLYPKWKEELLQVLDPKNGVNEWILYGSIGTGKTSAACVAQLYKLYLLSCMKSPQKLFGLAEHFPVYFAFFSVTKGKAEDAINAKFQNLMNMSPYFREKLPKNPRKVFLQGAANLFGAGYREHPKKDDLFELTLPHNLHLLFGSQTQHALSLDVFSATLDEMNFRAKKSIREEEDENSARSLYHQVRTRIESRFKQAGFNPGLLINISSARSSDSFVEQRIQEVRNRQLANVHISDFALWDVKPGRYGTKKFRVFVSSGFRSSRILEKAEQIKDLREGEKIIEIPETFRESFETSLDASIRDLAGVATAAVNKLFRRREIIPQANGVYVNPIQPETLEIGLQSGLEISDFFDIDQVSRYDNIQRHLHHHARAGRFIHVDLAKRGDCVGITSLCIPFYYEKHLPHTDEASTEIVLKLPFVFVDFVTRIKAPKMDEISFEKVRQFIVWLRDNAGYPIVRVSYDSWQSIHSIQLLQENGFETETISVDKTDQPYMELLNAFVEHRLMKPPHSILDEELKNLEHDIMSAKGQVDHPVGQCLTGDTRIPLLDGTRPCIEELALTGKEIWVYSSTPGGKIVPGKGRARKTKETSELLDVILDSGAVIRCTPEHPFMLRDGNYCAAKELVPGVDRLMPINFTWPINGGYERLSNAHGERMLTHQCVDAFFAETPLPIGWGVHHKNGNKTDNRPENLERIKLAEHARKHTTKRHIEDPSYREKVRQGTLRFNSSIEGKKKHAEALQRTMQEGKIDFKARARRHSFFRADITLEALIKIVDRVMNPGQAAKLLGCGRNVIIRVLRDYDLQTWEELRTQYGGNNHKVRALIPVHLANPVPVYDLEVDIWDNFALCAGIFVHNSKDVADSLAGAYQNALEYIHKNGFGAIGSYLVQESVLPGLFAKHPKEIRAAKLSREMGYTETVHYQDNYDGRFYGTGRTIR